MRKGILFAVTLAVLWVFFAWGNAWSQENLWNDMNQKVLQLYKEGKYEEGMKVARQALEAAEKTFGPEHLRTAASLSNLAEFYYDQGRYSDAEVLYKRILAIREKVLGPMPLN